MRVNLPSLDAAQHEPRPNAKPPKREKKTRQPIKRSAKPTAERDAITKTREYVFARERGMCRCCRLRPAESMHEIIPRSRGGKVSKRNSIAVCGQLGNGAECHGLCQRNDIRVVGVIDGKPDAEYTLWFYPETPKARDWMKLGTQHGLESAPMRDVEAAE